MPAPGLHPGDLIAGRYVVADLLDESRGGRFWRAGRRWWATVATLAHECLVSRECGGWLRNLPCPALVASWHYAWTAPREASYVRMSEAAS